MSKCSAHISARTFRMVLPWDMKCRELLWTHWLKLSLSLGTETVNYQDYQVPSTCLIKAVIWVVVQSTGFLFGLFFLVGVGKCWDFARIHCWFLSRRQHLVLMNSLSDLLEYLAVNDLDSFWMNNLVSYCSLTGQKEQQTACHLTVQTRGNLSFFIHKQVKCVVVGSLVTTHRKFKGLLLLSRSPLFRPITNPSYNDFCPRDLPVASGSAVSPAAGSARVNKEGIWASWVLQVWFFVLAFEMTKSKQPCFKSTESLPCSELADGVGEGSELAVLVFVLYWCSALQTAFSFLSPHWGSVQEIKAIMEKVL